MLYRLDSKPNTYAVTALFTTKPTIQSPFPGCRAAHLPIRPPTHLFGVSPHQPPIDGSSVGMRKSPSQSFVWVYSRHRSTALGITRNSCALRHKHTDNLFPERGEYLSCPSSVPFSFFHYRRHIITPPFHRLRTESEQS